MQSFLNSKDDIVSKAIDGVVAASGGKVARFPVDHSARVVARTDIDKSKVAIVSGGGSGHEPAHAGFVGQGMISAAVCGEIFASPSIDAVLSAILTVTGEAGCLVIVKNYTGDRLNFGLATEKAKALGLNAEMVIIGDDVAIENAPQPRGVAGTLFIHKLAGFMAERGDSLSDIADAVRAAGKGIFSLGSARDTCTVPGNEKIERLAADEVEIGLGIHGEPGVEIAKFPTPEMLVADLAERLEKAIPDDDTRYALLFNNLGGMSEIESSILFADLMEMSLADRVDLVIGPAAMMTALDMPGFSISLCALNDGLREALIAPVGPAAWPGAQTKHVPEAIVPPSVADTSNFTPSDDDNVRRVITAVADACIAHEDEINLLDAKVGDGDTGSTFATAARTALAQIDDLPLANGADLLRALSRMASQNVGGSSGVLFAIMFAGAAENFTRMQKWGSALSYGLEVMEQYGGAKEGDRTMIDAIKPALTVFSRGQTASEIAKAARAGAERTATLTQANAGRSSYLNEESLKGVMDPGAAAIAIIFEALAGEFD